VLLDPPEGAAGGQIPVVGHEDRLEGDGATGATTRHVEVWLHEHHPDVGTEVHHGGQPLYPYLFGIE
jgi:hypothetical protein